MSLSTKIKTAVVAVVLAVAGAGLALAPHAAYAEGEEKAAEAGEEVSKSWREGMDLLKPADGSADLEGTAKNIINGVLYVVGLLAVVMVIIGGVQYTTSGGDQAKVTKAKNTILYGVVGLVIAILAYAIVNFVIGRIG